VVNWARSWWRWRLAQWPGRLTGQLYWKAQPVTPVEDWPSCGIGRPSDPIDGPDDPAQTSQLCWLAIDPDPIGPETDHWPTQLLINDDDGVLAPMNDPINPGVTLLTDPDSQWRTIDIIDPDESGQTIIEEAHYWCEGQWTQWRLTNYWWMKGNDQWRTLLNWPIDWSGLNVNQTVIGKLLTQPDNYWAQLTVLLIDGRTRTDGQWAQWPGQRTKQLIGRPGRLDIIDYWYC